MYFIFFQTFLAAAKKSRPSMAMPIFSNYEKNDDRFNKNTEIAKFFTIKS